MQLLNPIDIKFFKFVVKDIKKDTPTEVSGNCPVCGDKKHRLHLYRPDGFNKSLLHCFNAGCAIEKHTSMQKFLEIVNPKLAYEYKKETFRTSIQNLKNKNFDNDDLIIIDNEIKQKKSKIQDKINLDKHFIKCKDSRDCLEYVKSRRLTPHNDWYFSTGYFFDENVTQKKVYLKDYLVIPIYNNGYIVGFYSRNINKKSFITYLVKDAIKFWSCKNTDISKIRIMTEGIFDALSTGFDCSEIGSMLSASVPPQLESQFIKKPVLIFDNQNIDKTGLQKSIEYAQKGYPIFIYPDDISEKDINEMLINGKSKQYIKDMIEKNTFIGTNAIVRLKMKKI